MINYSMIESNENFGNEISGVLTVLLLLLLLLLFLLLLLLRFYYFYYYYYHHHHHYHYICKIKVFVLNDSL